MEKYTKIEIINCINNILYFVIDFHPITKMAEAPRTPVTPGVSGTPDQPPQLQQQPYGNGNNNINYSPIPFNLPPPDTPPAPTFNSQFETPSPTNQGHELINNPQLHNKPNRKMGQLVPKELLFPVKTFKKNT